MGFSRQEYWDGLPFLSPGDLPDPRIKPGSPKLQEGSLLFEPPGNSGEFIGRTDAKAEALTLWPPDATSQLIGEDPDVGKQKGMTEDKMVGWHHLLNGHESEQTLGDGEGQGSVFQGSGRLNWVVLKFEVVLGEQKGEVLHHGFR